VPAGSETLVLAEVEEALRELAREILELQGYTVLEARCPSDALRIGEHHPGPIHLLVTDVVMPQMGGRELAERLTRSRPDMKVLYLTGYTDDAIVRHGVLAARVPLLQKPFEPDALAWKVREVLDQPSRPSHRHEHPKTGKDGIGGRDAEHPPAVEPRAVTPRAPADATVRADVEAPEAHSHARAVVPSPFPYVAIVRRGEVRLFEALRTMLEAQGIAEVIWDRRAGERRSRERPA
jgi:CheY-like chemotaxis protein